MTLLPEITRHIATRGPMTVADYMARCNAHYYATRDPFGADGDFTTAPEISQIFGEIVGAWLADCWMYMGSPPAQLVEPGPGRGTLMQDILRATRNVSGFHESLEIRLIETSPLLRAQQEEVLTNAHPRISWQDNFTNLPALPLLLVANEFFDALPVAQYVRTESGESERYVEMQEERALRFTPSGDVVREASLAALTAMRAITRHIKRRGGAALIVDYGYTGESTGDTLQAVRRHGFVHPLGEPGEADLTAHVDFQSLLSAAKTLGAPTFGPIEQGVFLKRLGAELRAEALCRSAEQGQQHAILSGLERLVSPQQMGSLFKVIAVTSDVARPAGF